MARGECREVGRGKPREGVIGHGRNVELLLEAGVGTEVFNQGKGMIDPADNTLLESFLPWEGGKEDQFPIQPC